jgi:Protein of unknown function (DUF1549)
LEPDEAGTFEPLVATGFLVMGTKILAEKDTVKMGAETVDKQLDTVGRALLGLTLGCARCHDHKFDPVPTTDYYALAGILGSTRTMAEPGKWLERPAHTRKSLAAWRSGHQELSAKRTELQQLETKIDAAAQSSQAIELEAERFARGNVIVDRENYGKGIGIIGDNGPKENLAEYDIPAEADGVYLLQLRYAAAEGRPRAGFVGRQSGGGTRPLTSDRKLESRWATVVCRRPARSAPGVEHTAARIQAPDVAHRQAATGAVERRP